MKPTATSGSSGRDLLESPVRRELLNTLGASECSARGLTAAQLAGRLNLHVTTVRFHLQQLVGAGLVRQTDLRSGVGRPRRHYLLHPGDVAAAATERPSSYRALAGILAGALDQPQLSAEDAGRRWMAERLPELAPDVSVEPARTPGRWLAKVGAVVDLLGEWGYRPEVTTRDGGQVAEIALGTCPLRELAMDQPAVTCGVHRGMLRGTLGALGEPGVEVELIPFATPTTCLVRLIRTQEPSHPHQGEAS